MADGYLRDPAALAATVAAEGGADNGKALDKRQRSAKKREAAALLEKLSSPEAEVIRKLMELL